METWLVFLLLYCQGTEDACPLWEPGPKKASIPFRSVKCSSWTSPKDQLAFALSQEDKTFLKRLEEGIHQRSNNHYEMLLPLRDDMLSLPNNKSLTLPRLDKLGQRFDSDMKYQDDYTTFMNDIIAKGYVEKVPKEEASNNHGNVWYIPYHGVYYSKSLAKFVLCLIAVQTKRESI